MGIFDAIKNLFGKQVVSEPTPEPQPEPEEEEEITEEQKKQILKYIDNEEDLIKLINAYKGLKSTREVRNVKKLFEKKYPKFAQTLSNAKVLDFYPTPLECFEDDFFDDTTFDKKCGVINYFFFVAINSNSRCAQ